MWQSKASSLNAISLRALSSTSSEICKGFGLFVDQEILC